MKTQENELLNLISKAIKEIKYYKNKIEITFRNQEFAKEFSDLLTYFETRDLLRESYKRGE